MIEIQEQDFMENTSQGIVVIDFFASWCNPCKVLTPILEDLEKSLKGQVDFIKINAENSKDLCISLNIRGVPTVIIFKDGKEMDRLVGLLDKEKYDSAIRKCL